MHLVETGMAIAPAASEHAIHLVTDSNVDINQGRLR
jgi:hypothetical protein